MRESEAGAMVRRVWSELPSRYQGIDVDAFVVMPDHVHGVLWLTGGEQFGGEARPAGSILSLQDAIHRFKSLTTNRYMHGVRSAGWAPVGRRLWQDGFYERIVRSPEALERIRRYIVTNPERR
jgi:REP element-mobilizing transposase RayT